MKTQALIFTLWISIIAASALGGGLQSHISVAHGGKSADLYPPASTLPSKSGGGRVTYDITIRDQAPWSWLDQRAGGDKGKAPAVSVADKGKGKAPAVAVDHRRPILVGKRTRSSSAGSEGGSSSSPSPPDSPRYGKPFVPTPVITKGMFRAKAEKGKASSSSSRRESGYVADTEKKFRVRIPGTHVKGDRFRSSPEHPTSPAEKALDPPKQPRYFHRPSRTFKPSMKKTVAWPIERLYPHLPPPP